LESPRQATSPDDDVRVDGAYNGASSNGDVCSQTVEQYEKFPDAQAPGVGSGIQISLDGLGAVIYARRNRDNKKAAAVSGDDGSATSRDVEEASTLAKSSGGSGNKVLLSEVHA